MYSALNFHYVNKCGNKRQHTSLEPQEKAHKIGLSLKLKIQLKLRLDDLFVPVSQHLAGLLDLIPVSFPLCLFE